MSDLNFDWVKNNFDEDLIFFEVGCMNMNDTVRLRQTMPKAKIYTFEASKDWLITNLILAIDYGFHHFPTAVSDIDGEVNFRSSISQYGHQHLDSGSIFDLNPDDRQGKVYTDPYRVKSVRLETFCDRLNITPDFIHIDVEGAEYKVFQNIGKHKPKCVWAEVCTFEHYATGITRKQFDELMYSIGYDKIYNAERDSLYCLKEHKVSPYK